MRELPGVVACARRELSAVARELLTVSFIFLPTRDGMWTARVQDCLFAGGSDEFVL